MSHVICNGMLLTPAYANIPNKGSSTLRHFSSVPHPRLVVSNDELNNGINSHVFFSRFFCYYLGFIYTKAI
jgi:hypothetical protein